jgi:hypothetical protein
MRPSPAASTLWTAFPLCQLALLLAKDHGAYCGSFDVSGCTITNRRGPLKKLPRCTSASLRHSGSLNVGLDQPCHSK